MSDTTGRTGFRVTHTKAVGERRAIVHEMMRELDPKAVEYWARENTNIVVEDEVLDRGFVNDGTGRFVRATSMQEVIDYGQSRVDRLSSPLREDKPDKKGKMRGGTVTTSMFVAHLPKSLCKEVPDFYGKGRSRWIARDRDEAMRYFTDVLRFLGKNVIPGGFEAILGFDVQHSETTPHVQVLADTFADDPEHEGQLRPEWSRAYAAHRDVKREDGKMLTGRKKLERYQDDLKAYMVARGWPVERDVDPLRHDKTATKAVYGAMKDKERALAEQEQNLAVERMEVDGANDVLDKQWDRLEMARAELKEEREKLEKDKKKALEDARKEGYAKGVAEGRDEVGRLQETAHNRAVAAGNALVEATRHLTNVQGSRPLSGEQARSFFLDGVQMLANTLAKDVNDPAMKALIEAKREAWSRFAGSPDFAEFAKSDKERIAANQAQAISSYQRNQRRVESHISEVNESLDTPQSEGDNSMEL